MSFLIALDSLVGRSGSRETLDCVVIEKLMNFSFPSLIRFASELIKQVQWWCSD